MRRRARWWRCTRPSPLRSIPFLRMEITDAELKTRVREANLRADMETNQMRAQAALSNLKMVGDAAAASLNGIGSGVGNTVTTSISE